MKITELESRLKANADTLKTSIQLPDNTIADLKERTGKTVSKKSVLKKVGLTVASAAAVLVLSVNLVPNLAYASSKIPVLGEIVRVVTFGRFEVKNKGYEANVVTPKIEGLVSKELEDRLNNEFKENSQAVIAAFEKEIKELEKEFGEGFHVGVDANYDVRTDNDDILVIDTYIVNMAGSSYTKHSFYTIDKKKGTLLELKDLFKENADYITPISRYIIGEMRKENEAGTAYYWVENDDGIIQGFEEIKENQSFFINDAGNIVICFDKYEVAPGAYGCPEFEIPRDIVKDIVR